MSSKVERYVDAVRTVRGIERAINDEGPTPGRDEARLRAKREELAAYKALTGGELGRARRILAGATTAVLAGALLAGCATMAFGPIERMVTTAEADAYCRPRVRGDELAKVMHGCWIPRENTIVADSPWVLAHERRHADGWDHRGACHSTEAHPDGLTLDGKACEWFRVTR